MRNNLYEQSKETITSMLTEENQHTIVPACPEWTLRDLVGHQVGVVEDAIAGNLDDLGQPHWTAAQVQRHAALDLDGVKNAWDEMIAAAGESWSQIAESIVPDIAIHEFDVRGAVGNTEGRTSSVVTAAFDLFTGFLSGSFRANGVPPLRLIADDQIAVLGEGDPLGELRTSQFEFIRMVTGRRSTSQIAAMDWSGDVNTWLNHMSLMPSRETDLVE